MNRWTDVSSDINPWMKQVKKDKMGERLNERVIDFYRLIDAIDINQIKFTDFY